MNLAKMRKANHRKRSEAFPKYVYYVYPNWRPDSATPVY